jgi:VanZ family protein
MTLYYALFAEIHVQTLAALFDRTDLVLHVAAFSAIALPAFLFWRSTLKVLVGLVALAGTIEILQMMLPGRDASLVDLGASGTGILLGALMAIPVSNLTLRLSGAAAKVD